jgi:L-alanine-DL-glutamate epimerase-like enolase superfamily enzyme
MHHPGVLKVTDTVEAVNQVLGEVQAGCNSGWTLTEAARVLREAGAGPVLPLVLALDG